MREEIWNENALNKNSNTQITWNQWISTKRHAPQITVETLALYHICYSLIQIQIQTKQQILIAKLRDSQ